MPKFFFQLHNGIGFSEDLDGTDLETAGLARQCALRSIRDIVADEARAGPIDLSGYIDIEDVNGNFLRKIAFAEAFEVSLPGELAPNRSTSSKTA